MIFSKTPVYKIRYFSIEYPRLVKTFKCKANSEKDAIDQFWKSYNYYYYNIKTIKQYNTLFCIW